MPLLKVLVIEDSDNDAELLLRHLRRCGYEVEHERVETADRLSAALAGREWDIVISDYRMPTFTGTEALQMLKQTGLDIPFIMVSGTIGEDLAVMAMIEGASDYLMKDNLARLGPAIERELKEAEVRRQRRQAEIDLKESEKRLNLALRAAGMSICEWNLRTGEVNFSSNCYRILRSSRAVQTLEEFKDMLHPSDRAEVLRKIEQAISNQDTLNAEFRVVNEKGDVIWISNHAVIERENGEPSRMVGIISDITERKHFEKQLQESESHLRLSQEAARIGTWEWDLKTNRTVWSGSVWKMLGYQPGEIESSHDNWMRAVYPKDIRKMESEIDRSIHGDGSLDTEFRLRRKGGELIWIAMKGRVVRNEDGEPEKILGAIMDINEKKQAEEELSKSEEKLRQAQKLESIGRLAGGIAHDFNNMLTAINGYSDLGLRRVEKENPVYHYLCEIKKAGERSTALTTQLLAFSRQQILQTKVLNLNQTILDLTVMLRRLIGEDLELRTVLDPEVGQIKADPGQISQVLMNLIVNSRDALPNGGTIKIETENAYVTSPLATQSEEIEPGEYVLLRVSDNGTGIEPSVLEHIFEPFYTTKEAGKGTGLGLPTVYGIIRQSNGYINVESCVDIGTVFEIYLPRFYGEHVSDDQTMFQNQTRRGNETILFVEDEELVSNLTVQILESYGYNVIKAHNGLEALQIVKQIKSPIDLLLTDIIMPQMSGYALVEEVVKISPQTKVLFTSGYSDNSLIEMALSNRQAEFIAKPYKPEALMLKIREILDAEEPNQRRGASVAI